MQTQTLIYIAVSVGLVILAGLMSGKDSIVLSFCLTYLHKEGGEDLDQVVTKQPLSILKQQTVLSSSAAGLTLGLLSLDSVDMEVSA